MNLRYRVTLSVAERIQLEGLLLVEFVRFAELGAGSAALTMKRLACFVLILLTLSCTRYAEEPCCPAGAFCRAGELIFQDAQCTAPTNNVVSCVHLGDQRCHRSCLVDEDCVGSLAAVDEYSPDGGRRGSTTPYCVNVNFYANQAKPCLYPKRICMADPGDAGNSCPI